MAKRFVRVDLSDAARDFRPIALEPGVPMLDTANAHGRIVHRWLGDLAGEPEMAGDAVNFYVRTNDGGRLEEVVCQPATEEDLRAPLAGELQKIEERLRTVKAENSTERLLLRVLNENFDDLLHNEARSDRSNYFFKYSDVLGRLRIVWCWGFQRMDLEPAPTALCADDDCNLLFLRRPGQSPKCPACQAALPTKPKTKKRSKKPVFLLLLLLLCVLAAGMWYWNRNRLIARPAQWTGPEGARIEFRILRPGFLGFGEKDVTHQVVAISADTRIVRMDPTGSAGVAQSQGTTMVHFHYAGRTSSTAVTVTEFGRPERISLEPQLVELGVGTTQRLRLIGHYPGNLTADLTEVAQWPPLDDGVVYASGGLLEGLAPGTSTVAAKLPYRQSAEAPSEGTADPSLKQAADGSWYRTELLEATANVSVSEVEFASIEPVVEPRDVPLGSAGRMQIDGVAADGRRYSVLESSRLALAIEPPFVATPRGTVLQTDRLGPARLQADFNALSGEGQFEVVTGVGIESLIVAPETMKMAVGEIADLSIASPTRGRIDVTSSDPAVIQVTAANRLIGRAEGTAVVTVSQASESRTVQISVRNEEIRAMEISPSSLVVPVDHARQVRVFGRLADGSRIELAPDSIKADAVPSPLYADFDARTVELIGRSPTTPESPQTLALRWADLADSAPVEIVVAPFRLELTPHGPVDLPLGQMLSLEASAIYGGGYRVQLLPDRLQWDAKPAQLDPPGLELRGHKVAALKEGSGPLSVGATYFARAGNRVDVRSVAAEDVKLRLQLDRTLRLAGEPGTILLDGAGPRGDVELVPELAQFTSGSPDVVSPEGNLGGFRAVAAGNATVTATHPAAQEPAGLELIVLDPAKARIVLEPASAQLAIDEAASIRLYLEGLHNDELQRAELLGPGVSYSLEQPRAVLWRPPLLVGRSPAAPFEMSAAYVPHLARPAAARIEVLDPAAPTALRVVPFEAGLVPGQIVSLQVEAQWPGRDAWREVEPDAVRWSVPDELLWTDSIGGLHPSAGISPDSPGGYALQASFGGQQATARIAVARPTLDPGDLTVSLQVDREPSGRYLPIGQSQRYQILLRQGETQEAAADVDWPPDFENDYVRWRAPILSARQAGYQQWLTAKVGGRTVRFDVQTIDPMQPSALPPRRPDQPVEVRVVSDQGPAVAFPVGAAFDDFRVEAEYQDGFVRMVTKKATMSLGGGQLRGPVSFSEGTMIGVTPGSTVVEAEFDGVASKGGLQVTVSEKLDIDEILITPELVKILPGETGVLEAIGCKSGKSIGRITDMAGLQWSSSSQQVAQLSGSTVSGLALGQSSVTAQYNSITSSPAQIHVLDSIDDALAVDQDAIEMIVGESRRIGIDLGVFRGDTDFSRSAQVTSALPGVVRYDPLTHSLVGVAPGMAGVTFAWGDKLATTMVRVLPAGVLDGRIVVEPSSGVLSPGQALELRVYVVTSDGRRIDRTTSAVLASSDAATVFIQGNLACARSSGAAEITAQLPESATPGRSFVTVNNAQINELIADPSRLALSVGEIRRLQVLGRSESGTYLLFVDPDLQLTASGLNPGAVQVVGADVRGLAPGNADVVVNYQNRLSATVPVTVSDNPWTGLSLDPIRATVHPGQGIVYQASALRGGRRFVVTEAEGLHLTTSNPSVANAVGGSAVEGVAVGRAAVIAQLGTQTAEAAIDVVAGTGPVSSSITDGTNLFGPGYGHYGTEYVVRDRPGYIIEGGETGIVTREVGTGVGLRFSPDVLRLGMNSPGTLVRVLEVFPDGYTRDVSNDPALELTPPTDIARLDKMTAGPVLRPLRPGEARMSARLGNLVSLPELLIQVGDYGSVGGRLEVYPPTLELASNEVGRFATVQVDPGAGQAPFPVAYAIELPSGQGIVGAAVQGQLQGLSEGTVRVVLRANAPGTPYDGVSTLANVRVSSLSLSIQPTDVSLKVGETTPRMTVLAHETGRPPYPVPATLESIDEEVLAPAGLAGGTFTAQGLGGTQVRATYRGREALANVTVTGERFLRVDTTLESGTSDFAVRIEVLAAGSEGPLEYRVSVAGQPPLQEWVPSQPQGTQQRALLTSSRIPYGDRSARYSLILEARPQGGESAQRYPFTFRLESRIVEDRPSR